MKKITIVVALLAGIIGKSFAGQGSTDSEALRIFKVRLTVEGYTAWQKKPSYSEKCFLYRDHDISAYTRSGKLIGFSCDLLDLQDVPKEILERLSKNFGSWEIGDVLIFMTSNGGLCYYVGLRKGHRFTAVKVSIGCRVHVMRKIRIN